MNLKKLENKRNELLEELKRLKSEIDQANISSDQSDIFDELFDNKPIIKKPAKATNLNQLDQKLKYYELYSGITVEDVSFEYLPIKENNKTDTSWLKFDVDASVRKTKFHVTYISNQNLHNCTEVDIKCCEIKELNIKMEKQIHQVELQDCLDYFSANPSKIGLAMDYIREYDKLFEERRSIARLLKKENPNIVVFNLAIEDSIGFLEFTVNSNKYSERIYFNIKWMFLFDEKVLNLKEIFKIIVPYQEQTFMESITHNFKKLSSSRNVQSYGLYKPKEKREDEFIKPNTLTQEEKLTLLRNAMLAVKVAEA